MACEQALEVLKKGNERFASGNSEHPNLNISRRKETTKKGQHPIATIITCSDSRVPVEILFDQGIGDIFTVRNAGNVCGVNETATIEYGVGHLNTPLLVVLGHTHCGAVTAVVQDAKLDGSIPSLLKNIKTAFSKVENNNQKSEGDALINATIKANVEQSIDDLITNSEIVRDLVSNNDLKIIGAIYDIETGQVEWLS